jgi:PncC family amidohydrolase
MSFLNDRGALPLRKYEQGLAAAEQAFQMLLTNNRTVAFAESCTGGLLSSLLTEIPGASQVLRGGVCTYSVNSKIKVLEVDPQLITEFGVVSKEVALAMAEGVRYLFDADLGIATTGIAGPDGGTKQLPVGSVCWAIAGETFQGHEIIEAFSQKFEGNRFQVRIATVWHIFQYLQGMA